MDLLDDPQEWPAFGREVADGRWESHLVLRGMYCAACALTLEDALAAVPGVHEAQVNGATQRARVVWSAGATRPSCLVDAVRHAGYDAVPAADASARAERQREARLLLWRWGVAAFCMMQVMMYAVPAYTAAPGEMTADVALLLRWASWVLSLPVLLFSCAPFFKGAWRDLKQRRAGMDLPVALGMAIAFVVSTAATFDPAGPLGAEVYFDSLTMFVFFLLTGRWLEQRLRERTAGALEALLNRLPEGAQRQRADGGFERVALRALAAGDVVRVLPGEAFPGDGVVEAGQTRVDEALISGEARPLARTAGHTVLAGSHNLEAPVCVRLTAVGAGTRYARIVRLMEDAAVRKPRLALLADRVARPFLLCVLALATVAFAWHLPEGAGRALMAACAVLVVTCPCALSLATPAAMLAAAGSLARGGVLVRELQALEALASVDTVVFDKTGTLTEGGMALAAVRTRAGVTPADALQCAAALARHSLHPVSRSLVSAAEAAGAALWQARDVREAAGAGLTGDVADAAHGAWTQARLGSAAHAGGTAAPFDAKGDDSPQVHLSDTSGWLATFTLPERVRADARAAVAALQAQGARVLLLSGDRAAAAARVGALLGVDAARGDCSPQDKLAALRGLQAKGHRVAMVGDGLNDGPVLAGAQVSIAFGQAVPLAQARSDLVVLSPELLRVPQALQLARRTLAVVRQNLAWSAAYNAACVPLALAGWLPAWLAGAGMATSSLVVVLNAARLARPLPAVRNEAPRSAAMPVALQGQG